MLASSYKNCTKSIKNIMIKINKEIFKKALLAGIFSAFTIGVLTVLTYKSAFGLFIAGSFGSSMVLLFGFPESPFAQPKNVFSFLIISNASRDDFPQTPHDELVIKSLFIFEIFIFFELFSVTKILF